AVGAGARGHVVGNFLERAIGGEKTDFCVAQIAVLEIDAAIIGRPLGTLYVAIKLVGNGMRAGPVALHEVELGCLVALITVVIAGVGDPFSIGRNDRIVVWTFAIGQRAKRAIGDAEFVNLRVKTFVVGFRMAIGGDQKKLSIGCP